MAKPTTTLVKTELESPTDPSGEELAVEENSEEENSTEGRFHAVLVIEGTRSEDGRRIDVDALDHRELPLPLMMMRANSGYGHEGAVICGSIESIERRKSGFSGDHENDADEGMELYATGRFDSGTDGQEAMRLVNEATLRWVSVDLSISEVEYEEQGDCDELDILFGGGEDCEITMVVKKGKVMGATICPFPAFPQAVIGPEGSDLGEATADGRPAPKVEAALIASGSGGENSPHASWFEDPRLQGPTPLTITPLGRVYGHAWEWGVCHTGYDGVCLTAPSSKANYAYFRTGEIIALDDMGAEVKIPVGQLTFHAGHCDTNQGPNTAAAHYDNTAVAWADVVVGEDEFGGWVSGCIRPGLTDQQLREIRASSLSGDWRRIGGNLELMAILCVNVPGFPVLRSIAASMVDATTLPLETFYPNGKVRAYVKDGEQISLVAAGVVRQISPLERAVLELKEQYGALKSQLEAFGAVVAPMTRAAAEAQLARIRGEV